jgi:4-hydroxy-tetrahydrodipicolinate synthase
MPAIGRHVSRLSGYAPALPTPFDAEETIDAPAFERLCDLQLAKGATALVVCGTTGEAPTLSPEEHRTIIRIAVSQARGRIPVIAGAGSNATAHAIELTRDAEAAGADAVLSVVPYYNKPTQPGLYAHFRAIAESTGLPVMLYDVPSRTACSLADETIARLGEIPNIIGLKDAAGDPTRPVRLRSLVGTNFRLLSGDDGLACAYLAHGGDGCISVTSNVVPGICRNMFLACGSDRAADCGPVSRDQSRSGQTRPGPPRPDIPKGLPAVGRTQRAIQCGIEAGALQNLQRVFRVRDWLHYALCSRRSICHRLATGRYLAKVVAGGRTVFDRVIDPVDNCFYALIGRRVCTQAMDWKSYYVAHAGDKSVQRAPEVPVS